MNLLDLMIKVGIEDNASSGLDGIVQNAKNAASAISGALTTAAKVGGVVAGGIATAAGAVAKSAVENYADYEQLVGGVETLFKDSAGVVQDYAANAFGTAGLSANEYMDTVTSFAASMLQSLGGDTAAAASMSDQAITDMADNANKMGTSISMIQNAYQGFAKQNYTMLDNLKLGYGGTQKEMFRLMETAASLDETFAATAEFSLDSKGSLQAEFADITQAIHIVQTEMGITGTTAAEASGTISGSLAAARGAWDNLLTGMADENADIGGLVENVIGTAATAAENLVPRVGQAVNGVISAFSALTGIDLSGFAESVSGAVGGVVGTIQDLMGAFQADGITGAIDALVSKFQALTGIDLSGFAESITGVFQGEGFQKAAESLTGLFSAFRENLPEVISGIAGALGGMVTSLAAYASGGLASAGETIQKILEPFKANLSGIIEAIGRAVGGFFDTLAGIGIGGKISQLAGTVAEMLSPFVSRLPALITSVGNAFSGFLGFIGSLATGPLLTIAEGILKLFSPFVTGAADLIIGVGDALAYVFSYTNDKLAGPLQKVADAIVQLFEPFRPQLEDIIGKIVVAVQGFVSVIGKRAADDVSRFADMLSRVIGFLKPILQNVLDVAKAIVDFVATLATSNGDIETIMYSIGKFIGDAAAKGIQAWENLIGFFKGIPDKIAGFFDGFDERMANIGQSIIDGLKAGIERAWDGLKSFVSGLWDGLEQQSKDENEIKSPSRRYARIGAYLAQGVGVGWDEAFRMVEQRVTSAYNRLASGVGTTYGEVRLADSTMGKTSQAMANTMISAVGVYDPIGSRAEKNINLVVDGRVMASVVLDPLRDIIKQKGVLVNA